MKDAKIYGIDDMEYGHVYVRPYGGDYFINAGPIYNNPIRASVSLAKPQGVQAIINIQLQYNDKAASSFIMTYGPNGANEVYDCFDGPDSISFYTYWNDAYSKYYGVSIMHSYGGSDDIANNYILILDVMPYKQIPE